MKKNQEKKEHEMLPLRAVLGLAMQLGFSVSVVTVLCVYGGHWLDAKWGTEPYLFLAGIVLGLLASFGLVWQIVAPIRARASLDLPKK